jgi:hypothetical protein
VGAWYSWLLLWITRLLARQFPKVRSITKVRRAITRAHCRSPLALLHTIAAGRRGLRSEHPRQRELRELRRHDRLLLRAPAGRHLLRPDRRRAGVLGRLLPRDHHDLHAGADRRRLLLSRRVSAGARQRGHLLEVTGPGRTRRAREIVPSPVPCRPDPPWAPGRWPRRTNGDLGSGASGRNTSYQRITR